MTTPSWKWLTTSVLLLIIQSKLSAAQQKDLYPLPIINTTEISKNYPVNTTLPLPVNNQARDCADVMDLGAKTSTIYTIYPITSKGQYFNVFCDLETDGGGWTVIYRRVNGSQDFYRGWWFYACGFGNIYSDYFIGLDKINWLTHQRPMELMITLTDVGGTDSVAGYSHFEIAGADENFALHVDSYYGDAGDFLYKSNGRPFSTFDRDNDGTLKNCAEYFHGAYWYHSFGECATASNPFGYYFLGRQELPQFAGPGMSWKPVPGPGGPAIKSMIWKIRPMGYIGGARRNAAGGVQNPPPAPTQPPPTNRPAGELAAVLKAAEERFPIRPADEI